MWLRSIRTRVVVLSTLSALLLIGSIATLTYMLMARNMAASAGSLFESLVVQAERSVDAAVENAREEVDEEVAVGAVPSEQADAAVAASVLREAPAGVMHTLLYEDLFVLYVQDTPGSAERVAWTSGVRMAEPRIDDVRAALASGEQVRRHEPPSRPLYGMFSEADLGQYSASVPVAIPGVHAAVLEVIYAPVHEQGVLDATRVPMLSLTLMAGIAAMIVAMLNAEWMLSLVESLRRSADAVSEGQFDVHLPERGENEVTALARSINRLLDKLRKGTEAQTRFIADASHELATPIAGIRGYVNILRAWGAEDAALRDEAIAAIDRESRRMARLCVDMLSLIRSAEVVEYRSIRYDINTVARDALAAAATMYMDKRFEFSGPARGALWLHGDPDRTREVLEILLDNACRYTPAGGRVSLTTHRASHQIRVDVADTGVGIAQEDMASVFDAFYHCNVSNSGVDGGFGLGLAVAKHIVEASGGAITLDSTPGGGSTFSVLLPRQRVGTR